MSFLADNETEYKFHFHLKTPFLIRYHVCFFPILSHEYLTINEFSFEQEVTHKTEKINNLEREKAALIRELYQVRRKSDQPVCKPQSGSETVPMAPAAYI